MTPRQQRMLTVGLIVAGVGVAAMIGVKARQNDMLFFVDPTAMAAGEFPTESPFNLGGMVAMDSWDRPTGSLASTFVVTDFKSSVPVTYSGVYPDLFREGQGVVATGQVNDEGVFEATKVLAKHDENYMPPNVADALKKRQAEMDAEAAAGTAP
ncbi:MAG: cytochrome c maturation protein CcmE [Gammaproteobacteria bacterium]